MPVAAGDLDDLFEELTLVEPNLPGNDQPDTGMVVAPAGKR